MTMMPANTSILHYKIVGGVGLAIENDIWNPGEQKVQLAINLPGSPTHQVSGTSTGEIMHECN